jgi:TalC/MipB family fructose-6-phosphate aldolase
MSQEQPVLSLYLDTAVRADAEPLLALGIFRGLTTNPLLLRRAGLGERDLRDLYAWVVDRGLQEVFFQAWGAGADQLTEVGRRLAALGDRVVVKLPTTIEGVTAAGRLRGDGIPVLMTAVYSAPQALVAAAVDATYVAPYLGRMGDAGRPAHAEVTAMQRALSGVSSRTRVLVASVRSPVDVLSLAQEGVGCFAVPPAVAAAFFTDPLTQAAVEAFERAAQGQD